MNISSVGSPSYIYTYPSMPRSSVRPAMGGSSTYYSRDNRDSLEVSDVALRAYRLQKFVGDATEDGNASLDEISSLRDKYVAKARQTLTARMMELGVSSSHNFSVGLNEEDLIELEGDLSETEARGLRDALQRDGSFVSDFRAAASASTLVEAAEENSDFAKVFAQAAQNATSRYAYLLGGNWESTLRYSHGRSAFETLRIG